MTTTEKASSLENPRVYFDISIGKAEKGTIVFELFKNIVPRTAENFRQLCTGEAGRGSSGKMLHYQNSMFHRVIDGFMAQGGDFTKFNGTGGESIYGKKFADEKFTLQHNEKYLLSMANAGPNSNGSQFFILFEPAAHLNGKHVVFGRVERGQNIIEMMRRTPCDQSDKPRQQIKVTKCGQMKLKKEFANTPATGAAQAETKAPAATAQVDDSSDDEDNRSGKKGAAAASSSIMSRSKDIKKDKKHKKSKKDRKGRA